MQSSAALRMSEKFRQFQNRVFFITFFAYGMLHLTRKCYVNLKMKLQEDAHFEPILLSMMDTAFMLFYAIGSFFSGSIGELYQYPAIVSIGLFGSSLCVLLLSVSVWAKVEDSAYTSVRYGIPLLIWMLHGLMQSTGGPANTSIMGNWYGYSNRGYIFGHWVCHQYMGNIFAALLAFFVLRSHQISWTFALAIPSAANCIWGFVCLFFLPEHPEQVPGLEKFRCNSLLKGISNSANTFEPRTPSISFWEAMKIPNVIQYSMAFGLFKFVNYCIFFWLPFYLAQYFSAETSILVSIVYDIGMIPGGILVGTFSDMYGGRRACVIATFTITLIPFLLIFAEYGTISSQSTPLLFLLLAIVGCLIGGPINIITSAVAVDLSEHSLITGRNDLMAVTGIINGSGSVVASLGLMVVGPIQSTYGWKYIWHLITLCTVLGTLLLSPTIRRELFRSNHSSTPQNEQNHIGPNQLNETKYQSINSNTDHEEDISV